MNKENSRFWLGTGIGVLGLIPSIVEFARRDVQLGALFAFVLLLMFALFAVTLNTGRGPHYETRLLKKILTIEGTDGKSAQVRREQTIRARYGNLEGIWSRGNIVDGTMSEFKVDDHDPDKDETLGCSHSFYKRFTNPLTKGEERTVIWSYKAADSFLEHKEGFYHDTIPGIRKLEMVVNFPDGRKCGSAEFHVAVAGENARPQDGLKRTGDGKQLVAEVKWPTAGCTYRIDWEW